MKLSEHFSSTEWSCKCGCGQMIVNEELVDTMESIRDFFGKPVVIHCVNRCPKHNAAVGGVSNSQHVKGNACDFHVRGLELDRLHEAIIKLHEEGTVRNLGLYEWGCHIDIRKKKHFWDNR